MITRLTAGLPADQLPLRGPGVADLASALSGQPQRCKAPSRPDILEVLETIADGDGTPQRYDHHLQPPGACRRGRRTAERT